MRILVIIPAYNEERTIGQVVREIREQGYEVLVVDDGSADQTIGVARGAGAKVLRHFFNLGQGAALQTGFEYAQKQNYDIVVTFDADGQHEVKDITKILEPLLLGKYDVVLGSRFLRLENKVPLFKKIVLKLAVIFTRLTTGLKVTDAHNGLRALATKALEKVNLTQNGMAHASEILAQIAKNKLKYGEMPVSVYYTRYSQQKGQTIFNSFKILWELFWEKVK